ncbi:MAG: type II toxin-antitoxin system RelE/ParE family toxin [Planctomycetota bacterium]|nr:type II toxin-antitoxin system RelE/ParE family toxin [Planctomycetota bacterium]
MPRTRVVLFKEEGGGAPLLAWLDRLDEKARAKCVVRIERLAEIGHALRRPEADFLRDGIYELRTHRGHVQYRMLYFFHGRSAVVLSHGFSKEKRVPPVEIELAISRKKMFEAHPARHTLETKL